MPLQNPFNHSSVNSMEKNRAKKKEGGTGDGKEA
jgi:hypothetical protein